MTCNGIKDFGHIAQSQEHRKEKCTHLQKVNLIQFITTNTKE